jgi:hypothetical protein
MRTPEDVIANMELRVNNIRDLYVENSTRANVIRPRHVADFLLEISQILVLISKAINSVK